MASWSVCLKNAPSRLATYILSLNWLSVPVVLQGTLLTFFSYWAYQLGHFLGKHTRTPETTSVFSACEIKILQDTISPQKLRWYAWGLLWSAIGMLIWSAYTILNTSDTCQDNTVSGMPQKLPRIETLPRMSTTVLDHKQSQAKRVNAVSWAQVAFVLICFAFAFIKKQHVGAPLLYHPVNSPVVYHQLLPHMHSTSAIDQGSCKKPEEASIVRPYMLSRHNDQVVPPILHFVFGLNQTFGGKNFGYVAYLSMYSGQPQLPFMRVILMADTKRILPRSHGGNEAQTGHVLVSFFTNHY